MVKSIENIFNKPANYNMVGDGFRVYNYFPTGYQNRARVSPFLMLDFNPEFNFGPSDKPRGVGSHPHKGFETVTIAYKGSVAHQDSKGNSGVINPGDVQWMTAGAGILHKEFHEENFSKTGGPFQMVQLWVNLPSANKLTPANYQAIEATQMGKVVLENNGGSVNVIAGICNGTKGPAKTFTDINLFDVRLNAGGKLHTTISALHNCSLLLVEGEVEVNGRQINSHAFVVFKNEGEEITITASKQSIVLVLSGTPINEPIAQYGPFVMNTREELYEAIDEFNAGKFGVLN